MSWDEPREIGGVWEPRRFADQQVGPTCGFEAIENLIQLYIPTASDLSDQDLIPRAEGYNCVFWDKEGPVLETRGYRQLLMDYGIRSAWHPLDRARLLGTLKANRVVLAIVDAHVLDPATYPKPRSLHAIVLTNFVVDHTTRAVTAYTGLDSNHPDQERWWSLRRLEKAVTAAGTNPLLVTSEPIHPDNWADPYPASVLTAG